MWIGSRIAMIPAKSHIQTQRLADQLAAASLLLLGYTVYLHQEVLGERKHHLGYHGSLLALDVVWLYYIRMLYFVNTTDQVITHKLASGLLRKTLHRRDRGDHRENRCS
jgi:hypothetical protein